MASYTPFFGGSHGQLAHDTREAKHQLSRLLNSTFSLGKA